MCTSVLSSAGLNFVICSVCLPVQTIDGASSLMSFDRKVPKKKSEAVFVEYTSMITYTARAALPG